MLYESEEWVIKKLAIIALNKISDLSIIIPYSILKSFPKIEVDIISLENKLAINLESGLKIHCDYLFEKTNLSQYNAIYLPGGVGAKWFSFEKWGKPHPLIVKLEEIIKRFLSDKDKYVFMTHKSFESMCSNYHEFDNLCKNTTFEHPLIQSGNFVCVHDVNHLYDFTLLIASLLVDIDYNFMNHSFVISDGNANSKLEKIKKEIDELDDIDKNIILNSINRFSEI